MEFSPNHITHLFLKKEMLIVLMMFKKCLINGLQDAGVNIQTIQPKHHYGYFRVQFLGDIGPPNTDDALLEVSVPRKYKDIIGLHFIPTGKMTGNLLARLRLDRRPKSS